ncbi:hypothetical protein AN964_00620 [Heyndrickxia shackletonii]|uniref:Spore germination protein (Amino acid permease) n=1 Tax=Heyndrickxia shackletonii TaxID=157838 RepID=A0A0Q3TDR6_9BACI|nr:hypothetical protein AN964_00620 [Heyndrickxia shackletonii]
MNTLDSITNKQMMLILITVIGLNNHVFVISPLVQHAGKDSWISVILSFLLSIVWIILLLVFQKSINNEGIFEWLRFKVNKKIIIILGIIFILFLINLSAITLRETIALINVGYLPETPKWIVACIFSIVCLYFGGSKLGTISIINILLLIFVVCLGFFVAFTNMEHKDYSLLLPIFENGYSPILKSIIFPYSGMTELMLFLFLKKRINTPVKFRHLFITSFILMGLTLGPLIGAITEFDEVEASYQRFPAFEEWGLVSIGDFIEHVSFLALYQWLAGAFIRISLFFYTIKEVLLEINLYSKWCLFVILFIVIGYAVYPISDIHYSNVLWNILLPFTTYFLISFLLLLSLFILVLHKRRINV